MTPLNRMIILANGQISKSNLVVWSYWSCPPSKFQVSPMLRPKFAPILKALLFVNLALSRVTN